LAANLDFFSKSLTKIGKMQSCIEFCANIGSNLQALKLRYPDHQQFAIEINSSPVNELLKFMPETNVFQTSILILSHQVLREGATSLLLRAR
jgi:hypothetical protein